MNDREPLYRCAAGIAWLILACLLVSCGGDSSRIPVTYHLADEFEFAEQTSFTRDPEKPPFLLRHAKKTSRGSRLIQIRPGEIRYYMRLHDSPRLQYILAAEPSVAASIEIRSDDPTLLTERVDVVPGSLVRAPLDGFANRVIELTLRARTKGAPFDEVDWGNPLIESIRSPETADNEDIEAFRARHRNRNVLLVFFDALNPFHLGCYGYGKPTTPNIDTLAKEAVVWDQAVAPATYTHASTGSLLTGLYPDAFTSIVINGLIPPEFQTMSESFRNTGYRTALFTANPNAAPLQEHNREFDAIRNFNVNRDSLGSMAVMAEEFVEPFRSWIDQVQFRPFFGYLHFREPHTPYLPPREYRARFLSDPDVELPQGDAIYAATAEERPLIAAAYDANLAYADAQLGKILSILKSRGLDENTIVVFSSDHGEALWEHGHYGHFWPLYEEVIRIPLILHFPQETGLRNLRKPDPVSTIDLFPTFADLFGFSGKETRFHGKSLLPLLAGGSSGERRILLTRTDKRTYSARTRDFKYIHDLDAGTLGDELYHLAEDPGETVNLIREHPVTAAYLRIYLEKAVADMERNRLSWKAPPAPVEPDEETKKQLKALGYTNQ